MQSFLSVILLAAITSDFAAAGEKVPTFTKDVAPILFGHCATCHRPGQIGPFSLLKYADAKKRADQVARVVEKKMMPPWKPQPDHGEFIDARTLSAEQIATLKKWSDSGAPEGDVADLPSAPAFKDGWQLGTPDLILKMPRAFTVPAEGNDIYQHFVFPSNLSKTMYITAVEVLPGNRRVAHHAIGLLDSSGTARRLSARAGGLGYPGPGSPGFIPSGLTPGYVPGTTPRFFPADTAIPLKRGTDFVLQMHYHPTGKEETDLTTVGLYLTDKKPSRNIGGILMGTEDIDIAPGVNDYTRIDSFKLPANFEVRDIWAHMHMIGKTVHVWAELPDGSVKQLLKIVDWDFNWQDSYRYAKPFTLPRGTILKSKFVFDNSADNPRNPNVPPARVRHGERSVDEMGGIWIGGVAENWQGEIAMWGAVIGHYLEVAARKGR